MQCLFINLASHDALVTCSDDQSVIALQSAHTRISDADLIPMAEASLEDAGWAYTDLTHLACIVGPGGFTSLRIAVAFANVLADQLGVPSAGIHLSDLYRRRVQDEVYWLHSTKKDQLFIRGGAYEEPALISTDDLSTLNSQLPTFRWMGELIDEHRALVVPEPIDLRPIEDVLPALLADQTYSENILQPWYGRGW